MDQRKSQLPRPSHHHHHRPSHRQSHHTHHRHDHELDEEAVELVPSDPGVDRRAGSLLKFEKPLAITAQHEKRTNWAGKIHTAADLAPTITGTNKFTNASLTAHELREYLNIIFPPIEWEEHGQLFEQQVSSVQATDEDLKNLEKEIQHRMTFRHIRDGTRGIDECRREIFEQAFDEILRQITIENPERGFVLKRLRDELKMTFSVFKTLYDSSVAYSTRKSLLIECSHTEFDRTVEESNEALVELRKHVELLRKEFNELESQQKEIDEHDRKRRQEEIDYFKELNIQLKAKLENFLAPIKKGI